MVVPLREKLPGISLYWSLTMEEKIVVVITQDRVVDDNLKKQIQNQTCRLFLQN